MASSDVMAIPVAVTGAAVPTPTAPAAMQGTGVSGAVPAQSTKGSSLWVGELAADVNESKLYEFFNPIASVQSVRVCRNAVTKESLGYAYVNFQTPADAEAAMDQRNYNELNGKVIRIMWAQRDPISRRNNVGNVAILRLPTTFSDRNLHDVFKDIGNILSVKVARDDKGQSKGYGFVHFDSDRAAKDAIELVNGTELEDGKAVQVKAYMPRTQRQTAPDKWTNMYAKNVPKSYSDETLKSLFAPYGSITSAVVQRDETGASRGFGFVCFAEHESAAKALEALNEKDVDTLPNLTAEDLVTAHREDAPKKEGEEKKESSSLPRPKVKLILCRAMKKNERERLQKEKVETVKRERQAKFHGCNLFVRNLDDSVDDELLRKEFTSFGTITSAKVVKEEDGRSRGHGFVCFETPESASKAQSTMHRKLVAGKPLFVALWEAKEIRSARFNAAQAQPGAFGGRARGMGAMQGAGMQGGMGNQAMVGAQAGMGGMNPAMMMGYPAQQMMMSMLMMLSQNPQMNQAMRGMEPNALTQMLGMAMSQQMNARSGMGGMGNMGGASMGGMSPTAAGAAGAGARGPNQAGAVNRNGAQQFNGWPGAAMAGQAGPGMVGQQGARGPARGPAGSTRGPTTQGAPGSTPPGPARVAAGPMQGAPGSRPMSAVAGMGPAGARGPVANGPRPGAPGQAMQGGMPMQGQAGPRPGMMQQGQGNVAANMQYRDGARNMPGMGMMPGMANMTMEQQQQVMMMQAAQAQAQSMPAQQLSREQFLAQLSGAEPQQRKNLIGEHLYTQVQSRQPALAGKITGMLLDGMDDSELLVLLETPQELESRIAEAMDVLEQHKRSNA